MVKSSWTSDDTKTLDILLDYQNSRIDANEKSSQEEIRKLLLKTEDVIDLANSIISTKGLLRGERIIIVKENGNSVVLEGNRRTCACQLLLNPELIPKEFRTKFPICHDEEIKKEIEYLKSDIAPDRLAAEITITKRHTEPGVSQWTPIAKQRRITRLVEARRSIEELMSEFGMTQSNILKTLKDYHIFQYAKNLSIWNKVEKDILNDPTLSINPFTRFFDLKGVKKALELKHKETGELEIEIKKELFDKIIAFIAREFLIPDKGTSKLGANTRTTPEELFKSISSRDKDIRTFLKKKLKLDNSKNKEEAKSGAESAEQAGTARTSGATTSAQTSAKPGKFFENLSCPLKDNQLLLVVNEISDINYKKYRLSATFLVRALVERILNHCIDKYALKKQLLKEFYTKHKGCKGIEPGLEFVVDFCIKNHDQMFNVNTVRNILRKWKGDKDLLDIIIHGRWANPSITNLEHFASLIRPTVEQILSGNALK